MYQKRQNFDPGDLPGAVHQMVEEDQDALSILIKISYSIKYMYVFPELAYILDDMNIRGKQISICFQEYCHSDMDLFVKTVLEAHLACDMMKFVNKRCEELGIPHRAVMFGAKEMNRIFVEEKQ
jgi:hypothetical protein